MTLKRVNLTYTDYRWDPAWHADDPEGQRKDPEGFDRMEGYEVLQLINAVHGIGGSDLTLASRLVMEWMIRERLPPDIHDRFKALEWLVEMFPTLSQEYSARRRT